MPSSKKQIVWSRGLRDSLGMGKAKTDKKIAEEVDLDATLVCTITPEQWKLILMYKVRGMVLQIAQGGAPAFAYADRATPRYIKNFRLGV